MDLPQPAVLRIPRVIHRHRSLRDGRQRKLFAVGVGLLERCIPYRQRVEITLDARAQMIGRLASCGLALGREPEFLHHIRIQLDDDGLPEFAQAIFHRPVQIRSVAVAHELHVLGHHVVVEAVVLLVLLDLLRVGRALHGLVAVFAAPADQKAGARVRRGLEVHEEVGVTLELARAIGIGESRKLQTARQFDQHLLERLALTRGRQHRNTHRVDWPIEFGNRPVEHRHRIVAFEVGRVRQDQVGVGGHFRLERVAHHDERDLVLAA